MELTITIVDSTDGRHRDHVLSLPSHATVADLAAAVDPGSRDTVGDPAAAGATVRHPWNVGVPVDAHGAAGLGPAAEAGAGREGVRPLYLGVRRLDPFTPVAETGIRIGTVLGLGGPVEVPDLVRLSVPGTQAAPG
ncbi:hypothetical protein, partial [Nonomuraea aridisoli]